jgi:hypothetical protein
MTPADVLNLIEDEFAGNRIPGWCPLEKAFDLATLILGNQIESVLETGVFGGKSLIPMALAMKADGRGKVVGVDPWSPKASTEGYTGENLNWWGKLDHEGIYRGFLANLKRLGLENHAQIFREKSDNVALTGPFQLFHADSQHTEMAIREIDRFGPLIPVGGYLVLDDLEWVNDGVPHVAQAVTHALQQGFVELYRRKQPDGCWGVFQRVK